MENSLRPSIGVTSRRNGDAKVCHLDLRDLQRPGAAEHKGVAKRVRVRRVLVLILEKQKNVFLRQDEVALTANRVYGVTRKKTGRPYNDGAVRKRGRSRAPVICNL